MKKILSVFTFKEKIEYLCLIFSMFFGAVLDMASVMLIVPFINILSGTYKEQYWNIFCVIEDNNVSNVISLGVIILIICVARGLFLPLLLKWQYLFVQRVEHRYAHNT